MGLIPTKQSLELCEKVTATSFCRSVFTYSILQRRTKHSTGVSKVTFKNLFLNGAFSDALINVLCRGVMI